MAFDLIVSVDLELVVFLSVFFGLVFRPFLSFFLFFDLGTELVDVLDADFQLAVLVVKLPLNLSQIVRPL